MVYAFCWLIAMIILVVIEVITLGLTCIWFAGGALVAAIAAVCGANIWIQVALFAVVSILLLIFTRPIAKKYFTKNLQKTNAEDIVGKKAVIVEPIDNVLGQGKATVGGLEWTARSKDDSVKFEVNEVANVVAIEGVKIILEKVNKEQ